jgi:hypothetical protein
MIFFINIKKGGKNPPLITLTLVIIYALVPQLGQNLNSGFCFAPQ